MRYRKSLGLYTLLLIFGEAHLLTSESLTDVRLLISSALDVGPPLKILLATDFPTKRELSTQWLD